MQGMRVEWREEGEVMGWVCSGLKSKGIRERPVGEEGREGVKWMGG